MWNDALWNEELWNDSGISGFVPIPPGEIVTTPDPGVSFTVSDELGPEGGLEDSSGSIC
jgi:hypothetical protein